MIERHLAGRGICDPSVLEAMRQVPREAFVPEDLAGYAYADCPLPIGRGQTISQPYIVALMAEAAQLADGARVLEIGTGSGYAAAVLSRIAAEVYTVERDPELADRARLPLAAIGCHNVSIRTGDGTQGWPEAAPFDAIVAAAGAPRVPEPLKAQLAPGGRLIVPVGPKGAQTLLRVRRTAGGYEEENLGSVSFVPLIGRHGWAD